MCGPCSATNVGFVASPNVARPSAGCGLSVETMTAVLSRGVGLLSTCRPLPNHPRTDLLTRDLIRACPAERSPSRSDSSLACPQTANTPLDIHRSFVTAPVECHATSGRESRLRSVPLQEIAQVPGAFDQARHSRGPCTGRGG
jgi:hypothetical protein